MSPTVNKVQSAPAQLSGVKPYAKPCFKSTRLAAISLAVALSTTLLAPLAQASQRSDSPVSDARPSGQVSGTQNPGLVPVAQGAGQGTGIGAQPTTAPRRSVILTPAIPDRTIVPPPTSAFPQEEAYTLGPGDILELTIFDVPELSGAAGRYVVQLDGTVNLTWAGTVRVLGLTVAQAEQVISQAYAPFILSPLVTATVVTTRSLRISLAGEVKRPGAYVISPEGATDNRILVEGAGADGGVANQWPTVTKAIQAAGGLTQFADLRRVQVRRPLTDGSLEVIDINLWELLRTGELNQDIRLRDRDTLVIPTATTINDSEALVIGAANFAPQSIRVNVIGQVPSPGVVEIPPNTPMNQALFTVGGFLRPTARTKEVELVRLNSNGTASRRVIEVDLAAGINEATNPALRDYDTIIVSRNGATVFRENVDTILEPFDRFLGIFNSVLGTVDTIEGLGGDD